MSSVQVLLQQLWNRMNQTYYRRTSSQLPSTFYYMITPIANLYFYYHYFDEFSDPKLRGWPLMGSIIWPVMIVSLYLIIVYHGHQWLKNATCSESSSLVQRWILKAWSSHQHQHHHSYVHKLHHHHHHHHHNKIPRKEVSMAQRPLFSIFLVTYNVSMAALNAWIAYELLFCAWKSSYNFLCQLVYTGTDNPYETRIAIAIWWYFASKGIELLDTVLIIVKRKANQLTFLHIYHHSTMFIVWWVGAKFVPGGSAVTGASINCIVHVLMYSYYALASLGPRLQPYLWWKKYLTIIQLIQFTLGVTLGLNSILTGCQFTRWMQYVFVCYAFSFLILFGNFYRNTYSQSSGSNRKTRVIKKMTKETKSNGTEMEMSNKHIQQSEQQEKQQGKRNHKYQNKSNKHSTSNQHSSQRKRVKQVKKSDSSG